MCIRHKKRFCFNVLNEKEIVKKEKNKNNKERKRMNKKLVKKIGLILYKNRSRHARFINRV